MLLTKARRWIGLVIMVVSVTLLIWGLAPQPIAARTVEISSRDLLSAEGGTEIMPETRILHLKWPNKLRAGDPGAIRILFDLDNELGKNQSTPSAVSGVGGFGLAQKSVLQARLDLPGIAFTPSGEVSQAFLPDEKSAFIWNLRAREAGDFTGQVWLYLIPIQPDSDDQNRVVLTVQRIEIAVDELMGLGGMEVRALGALGLGIGALLGLDRVMSRLFERNLK